MSASEYSRLVKDFRTTCGFAVYEHICSLQVSIRTLEVNERELVSKLKHHSALNPLVLRGHTHRKELQEEFWEIIRLLHNYVASVASLIEHSRRISREILVDDWKKKHDDYIKAEFDKDPLARFVKELRNYLLHYSNPPIKRTIRFHEDAPITVGIELSTEALSAWTGWKAESKAYMAAHPESIELLDVVFSYREKVRRFYGWLGIHFERAREADLNEFWFRHDKWAAFCRSNGIPITEEERIQDIARSQPPSKDSHG